MSQFHDGIQQQPHRPQPKLPDPFLRPQPPVPQPPKRHRLRGVLIASGTGLVGLIIGLAAGGTSTSTEATPSSTTTVSAPPVTITAPPAPAVTVTKPAPPAKTVTQKPAEAPAAITGDGTYEVGVDLVAGKYKSQGGDSCYWARLSSLDGSLDSIIANNISDGPQTVTIRKSDKGFETNNCGEWKKVG